VFLVEPQLLAQEQYLGTQGSPGSKCPSQELDALGDYSNEDKKQRLKHSRRMVPSCTILSMFTWGMTGSSLRLGGDSLRQGSLGKLHLFIVHTDFLRTTAPRTQIATCAK
jgi:hypothetical protein